VLYNRNSFSDSDKELVKQVKNELRQGILPIWDSLHNFCIYRCISRILLGQSVVEEERWPTIIMVKM
jgi:hypothetical protein